jgi:hypothetical protein
MTLTEAKSLTPGQTIICRAGGMHVSRGSETRWRVTGKVRTWKTQPERVLVPLKHGLYTYGYLHEGNLDLFTKEEA